MFLLKIVLLVPGVAPEVWLFEVNTRPEVMLMMLLKYWFWTKCEPLVLSVLRPVRQLTMVLL